jgi:subtilisin family serine protease
MDYVILRKRSIDLDDPFLLPAGAKSPGAGRDSLPFDVVEGDLTEHEAEELVRDPEVEEVIPTIPFSLIEPVDVPGVQASSDKAWGVEAVGATTSPQTGAGVTVAVLDTGIDRTHPAFAGLDFKETDLMDFTVGDRPQAGSAPDVHGHGTHVAGTIFGRDVNGVRIGVAPGVKRVLIGKVLGENGGPTGTIIKAITWAMDEGADVISMSLGIDFPGLVARLVRAGLPADIATSRALEAYRSNVRLFDRIAGLVAANVQDGNGAFLVAASGNESRRGDDPKFTVAVAPPAAADGFVSVGAVSQTTDATKPFAVARFSNTNCRVSAPGVAILSAKLGGGLVNMNGTSMATPHVAGVAALWIERLFPDGDRPRNWASDVQSEIESNVKKAPALGLGRVDVGLGVVQAPQ